MCWRGEPKRKIGGAERDRTVDLLNAMGNSGVIAVSGNEESRGYVEPGQYQHDNQRVQQDETNSKRTPEGVEDFQRGPFE